MNVIALSQHQFGLNLDLLAAMFRLRGRVFKDRLGWTVSVTEDLELDVYDVLNPTYLLLVAAGREVVGCVRLLPTTGPTMLAETFPQLLSGRRPPRNNRILESSRFSRATFMLFAAMIESLEVLGADRIVTVTDTRMERILRRAGWSLERLAHPQQIGKTMALAGFLHGSRETLSNMHRQAGVEGPILNRPEDLQAAA
jgi:N-acyl-L-homoserine lactone synthetase